MPLAIYLRMLRARASLLRIAELYFTLPEISHFTEYHCRTHFRDFSSMIIYRHGPPHCQRHARFNFIIIINAAHSDTLRPPSILDTEHSMII